MLNARVGKDEGVGGRSSVRSGGDEIFNEHSTHHPHTVCRGNVPGPEDRRRREHSVVTSRVCRTDAVVPPRKYTRVRVTRCRNSRVAAR